MSKSNPFIKKIKIINKIINNLLEENLNKLKSENLINLLRNNKIVLTFVAVIILFLSYLLLPTLYKQDQISKKLKLEILKNLNLNFNFTEKINYNLFPKPHFVIRDSSILFNNEEISKVKKLNVFISLDNLFSLNNINIKNLLIENANFNLNNKNYNFFLDLLKNNFLENVLKIKNSNVFFRNSEKEVLFINKIKNIKYYYDEKQLQNVLISKNELFNYPYEIKLSHDFVQKKINSVLNFNFLNLKINNKIEYNNNKIVGKADITNNQSKSIIDYKSNLNLFEFSFKDKVENPNYLYKGKINLSPFYSSFEGETQKLNLSHLLNINSLVPQILKTEILNNENVNFDLNIKAKNLFNNFNFTNLNLNSKIKGGLIDIDQTKYQWKSSAYFKLTDSLIFVKDGQLVLDAKLEININNIHQIHKYLLTPKNLRKNIKKIVLNLSYNFDQNTIELRDIRLDDKYNQNINEVMSSITLKDNKLQNKIYFKKLINNALRYYSG